MAEHIAVVDLARELRVKSAAIVKFARDEGMNLRSAVQPVSEAQAQKVRQAYSEGRIALGRGYDYGTRPGTAAQLRRCSCCELPYKYDEADDTGRCDVCTDHFQVEGEGEARVIARLSAHLERMRWAVQQAGKQASEHHEERDKAYRSRDIWKRVLVEVAVAHLPDEDGELCVCGAGTFPCVTRRQISDLNPGIAKAIERLEGLPEDEFQEVLYGDLKHLRDWNPY